MNACPRCGGPVRELLSSRECVRACTADVVTRPEDEEGLRLRRRMLVAQQSNAKRRRR